MSKPNSIDNLVGDFLNQLDNHHKNIEQLTNHVPRSDNIIKSTHMNSKPTTTIHSSGNLNTPILFTLVNSNALLSEVPTNERKRLHEILILIYGCCMKLSDGDETAFELKTLHNMKYPNGDNNIEIAHDPYSRTHAWFLKIEIIKSIKISFTQLTIFDNIKTNYDEQIVVLDYNLVSNEKSTTSTIEVYILALAASVHSYSTSRDDDEIIHPLLMRDKNRIDRLVEQQKQIELLPISSNSSPPDMLVIRGLINGQIPTNNSFDNTISETQSSSDVTRNNYNYPHHRKGKRIKSDDQSYEIEDNKYSYTEMSPSTKRRKFITDNNHGGTETTKNSSLFSSLLHAVGLDTHDTI